VTGRTGPAPARLGPARPLRIGLVGPIGCGKSTVAARLATHGASVIDADALARAVTEADPSVIAAIAGRFGPGLVAPGGTLDRAALGRIVFAEPSELRALEAIVSPAVRPRIVEALAAAGRSAAPIVVLEAIRLVEAGYVDDVDEVWLVVCSPESQDRRLAARGLTADESRTRVAAQAGLMERAAAVATRVIETSGSLPETDAAVDAALDEALRAATARSSEPA
jgi:dephospho-CoA kinase